MKRSMLRLTAALMCLALLSACGGKTATSAPADDTPESVTVTDDLGTELTVTQTPARVVALTGSFAETWLLAGGTLCATVDDAWDDFDLALGADVTNLGSSKRVSLEMLFDTEPDLVIASANTSNHMELRDTLRQSGVETLYFDVSGVDDYLRMLSVCTALTGRADLYEQNGLAVLRRVEAAKQTAAEALKTREAPRVLFLRAAASGVHAKGSEGTVLGEMLADLGCVNIADGSSLLEDLSIEKIISEDPDRIFIVRQGDDAEAMERTLNETLTGNPAWAGLSAVQEGRVHIMEKQLYHFKPNARWGEAYEQLAALLYGA